MTVAAVDDKPAVTTPPAADPPAVPPAPPAAAVVPPAGDPPAGPPDATTQPGQPDGQPPPSDPPKAPETYTLTLPVDTQHLTDLDLTLAEGEAKALGLSNVQAQQLLTTRETQLATLSASLLADAKADPEIGGAKFDETVTQALAGRDRIFPPGPETDAILAWFDRTGLGNHKYFLRAMARVGRLNAEDIPTSRSTAPPAPERRETKDIMYEGSTSAKK